MTFLFLLDPDGDYVAFSTDEELRDALGFVTDSVFRVYITEDIADSLSNEDNFPALASGCLSDSHDANQDLSNKSGIQEPQPGKKPNYHGLKNSPGTLPGSCDKEATQCKTNSAADAEVRCTTERLQGHGYEQAPAVHDLTASGNIVVHELPKVEERIPNTNANNELAGTAASLTLLNADGSRSQGMFPSAPFRPTGRTYLYPPADPKIEGALHQMLQMGFNDNGRLRLLLHAYEGDIDRILDAIEMQPERNSLQGTLA